MPITTMIIACFGAYLRARAATSTMSVAADRQRQDAYEVSWSMPESRLVPYGGERHYDKHEYARIRILPG